MAKISETEGRRDANSGYGRLLGNQQVGQLISRLHATVIRTGNELEHVIEDATPSHLKATLEAVLSGQGRLFASDIQAVFQARMPGTGDHSGSSTDVVVFDHPNRQVLVIELKDGDTFDTKKSSGELDSMTRFATWIEGQTGYSATFYFCSFNQDDKEAIVRGAKGRFDTTHAMTGRELCVLLSIDYDAL
jgi:hypothetical protein